MPHRAYARLMDDYNEALSSRARAHGGEVLPPQGDGFVCVWCVAEGDNAPTGADLTARLKACLAAVDVGRAADAFNRMHPDNERLPTRIGLTVGPVTVFSNSDRGLFEVLGDCVNVAARLRDLNVTAGTSILASQAVAEGLDAIVAVRPLVGTPQLKGVEHAPAIVEICAAPADSPSVLTP